MDANSSVVNDLSLFLQKIGAPPVRGGAQQEEITQTENRLGGRFPDSLRSWYRQANGFDGEAEECLWRFKPLEEVHLASDCFPALREFLIPDDSGVVRRADCRDYAIVMDALINLPFCAVNIRQESPFFSEVLCAAEEDPAAAYLAASSFELYTRRIAQLPDDPYCFEAHT